MRPPVALLANHLQGYSTKEPAYRYVALPLSTESQAFLFNEIGKLRISSAAASTIPKLKRKRAAVKPQQTNTQTHSKMNDKLNCSNVDRTTVALGSEMTEVPEATGGGAQPCF